MKKRILSLVLIVSVIFLNGCIYDFIAPEVVPPTDPNVPVSFSTKIVPIFSTGTKCTSCHKPGGDSPDLTAANAFASIVPQYVNTSSPEQSKIYTFPFGSTGTHTWKKYNATEAALILQWIKEGAKNN